MKKKILCLATTFCMLFGMTPGMSFAAQHGSEQSGASAAAAQREIDQSTYDALGLKLDAEEKGDALQAPYSKEHTSQLYTAREVYTAVNGPLENRYILRDGFDRMETDNRDSDIYGQNGDTDNIDGAYGFYDVSSRDISSKNGNSRDSKLSSNGSIFSGAKSNVLKKEDNGFNGIYATSTAFNSGDGKDNYVAELRAYGKATDKNGAMRLCLFKINDDGQRVEKSKLDISMIDESTMKFGDSWSYLTRRYIQEMDAIMDVAAADVDGDGYDEIFAYSGQWKDEKGIRYAYVDMYSGKNGVYKLVKRMPLNAGRASSYTSQSGWEHYIKRTPVVTLAGGDLDRDGDDEVAFTVSAPTDNSNVAGAARMSVYDWDNESKSLEAISGLSDISLAAGDGRAMVSANCAFGTFALPDTSITGTVLIAAGYQSNNMTSNADSGSYGTAAYRYVYYDPSSARYRVSSYDTLSLGTNGWRIADSYVNDPSKGYYRPTHAPIALGCADMEGAGADNTDNEVLLGGEVYEFNTGNGFVQELMSVSVCADQVNNSNNNKDKEQLWISDVTSGTVDTDPEGKSSFHGQSAHKWRESFVYTLGVHRDETVNGSDDYYWMDLGAAYLDGDKYYSTQEGVIAESNHRGDDYGTFISLALPDVGNDSVKMRYVDQYTVYTDPEVYAVLQASPYFSDLAEVYDYIGNGGTAYGVSKSTGTTEGMSLSQSVGVYHSSEIQLFGGGEYEIEFSTTYSYDYAVSTEVEHSITYNNQAGGGDQVVLYTIPYVYYLYDMYDPVAGKWMPTVMPAAMDPVTTVLNVDKYDEIAEATDGLEPISGNLLHSTPGEPETYSNQPAGSRVHTYNGAYASQSSGGSGSDITQEISVTKGTEHTVDISMELNYKVGGGASLLGNSTYVGITGSTGMGASFTHSSTQGTTFSGTVDGLPEEASQYGFSWKLIVNSAELNGVPIWIVGYDVKDVHQPPRMPQDLTITEVGTDYIDLSWENSGSAAVYELSMVTSTGSYNKIATLPYTVTDYRVEGLRSNTQYSFSIRAVSASKGASINSPAVTGVTMNSGANFVVTEDPEDQTTAAGKAAEFKAEAEYTGADGKSKIVGYEWQYSAPDMKNKWKSLRDGDGVSGAETALLRVTPTEDMDGYRYRCRIYYMEYTMYTSPAVLTVDRSPSRITLDGDIKEGDVLSASGRITVSGSDGVTETVEGKEYNLTAVPVGSDGEELDGDVSFVISGPAGETVKAGKGADGKYTAKWTPKGEGKFTVAAVFAGNDIYYASESAPITVYAVINKEGRSVVSLKAPANAVYGNTVDLTVTRVTNGKGAEDITSDSSYTVEKAGADGKYESAVKGNDYTLENGRFTPKLTGSFRITAAGSGAESSAVIAVGKGSAVLSATDTTRSLNDKDQARKPEAAVLSGLAPWDSGMSLAAGTDYILTTEGETAAETGEYLITISLVRNSEDKYTANVEAVLQKYNISLKNAVYKLDGKSYKVTVSSRSNGSVSIASKSPGSESYIPVQSGALLPEGSIVKITAAPDAGYIVSKWKVNGKYLVTGENNFERSLTYTIDTLGSETDISVEFEVGKNTLTYSAPEGNGSVKGNYITATGYGEVFSSGSNINYNQSVRLTAKPDEGYAVDRWTVTTGNGHEETVKAADGSSSYTGITYDVSKINEDVTVKVYFIKDSSPVIIIKPVDDEGAALTSVKVSVNGKPAEGPDADGAFTYKGSTGDNVTIIVTPPGGVLVNEWLDADGQNVGPLTDGNTTFTLYALDESKELTVKCSALNRYTVNYSGVMNDGSDFDESGNSVSAVRIGSGAVTSGDIESQGATIQFSAKAAKGYEITGWTLNGDPVTAAGTKASQTYQIASLSEDVNVVVTFKKSDARISFSDPAHGKLSAEAGGSQFESGDPAIGDITFTVIPDNNYEVKSWKVNGEVQTGETGNTFVYSATGEEAIISVEMQGVIINVSAKAGEGGSIDPYIPDPVRYGDQIVLKALPDVGSEFEGWYLNGEKIDEAGASYTFDALESGVYEARFVPSAQEEKHTITLKSADHGSITAEAGGKDITADTTTGTIEVTHGTEVTFTAKPDTDWMFDKWTDDAENETGSSFTAAVTKDMTIGVIFKDSENCYVEYKVDGNGGDISATAGNTAIPKDTKAPIAGGNRVVFTAAPADGYEVKAWKVNGEEQSERSNEFVIESLSGDVIVSVEFKEIVKTVKLSIAKSENGSLVVRNSSGEALADGVSVNAGEALTLTAEPASGYKLVSIKVNDAVIKAADGKYIYVVKGSEDIVKAKAVFEIIRSGSGGGGGGGSAAASYTITASTTAGGSISPAGKVSVSEGKDQIFKLTADKGYNISDVLVDGKSVGAVNEYKFEKVKAAHTIEAVFKAEIFGPDASGVSELLETEKHTAYLSGYNNGLFGPKDSMTRAQAAQMFFNLLKNKKSEKTISFTDVPDGAWYADAVNTLSSMGIMNGTGEGQFAPERSITRAEFVAMAMRFAKQNTGSGRTFSDVSSSDWFYDQIAGASGYGWIDGYSDGTFRPDAVITRAEVAAVVNRMLARSADHAFIDSHASELRLFDDVPAAYWAYYDIAEAANQHEYMMTGGSEKWS